MLRAEQSEHRYSVRRLWKIRDATEEYTSKVGPCSPEHVEKGKAVGMHRGQHRSVECCAGPECLLGNDGNERERGRQRADSERRKRMAGQFFVMWHPEESAVAYRRHFHIALR